MPRFAANLSTLFTELPLLERFAAARDCGFAAAEIQFPYDCPADAVAAAANDAGIPIVLINAPMGLERTPGIACRPERDSLFRATLDQARDYAAALRVPSVNILAGTGAAEEAAHCRHCLAERLSLAAKVLASVGAQALLEPLNSLDVPGYCVSDFATASEVLQATDPRVGLQFDVYHAARMGVDPVATFLTLRPRVAHIQFADCPGRHEPGTGALPFADIFRAIDASGYAGWVGAEYRPLASAAESTAWLHSPWAHSS